MTEHKFKQGDKVKLKKNASIGGATGALNATKGTGKQAEAIVKGYKFVGDNEYLEVEWTEREKFGGHKQCDGGYDEVDFEPLYASPIKEVTKLELIPGNYGRFKVADGNWTTSPHVTLHFLSRNDIIADSVIIDAKELREAAKLFNQLADYLETK